MLSGFWLFGDISHCWYDGRLGAGGWHCKGGNCSWIDHPWSCTSYLGERVPFTFSLLFIWKKRTSNIRSPMIFDGTVKQAKNEVWGTDYFCLVISYFSCICQVYNNKVDGSILYFSAGCHFLLNIVLISQAQDSV